MRSNNEFIQQLMQKLKQKELYLRIARSITFSLLWFLAGFLLSTLVYGSLCPWHLVLCSAMPLLWLIAPTRTRAWLFSLGYYLGAAIDTVASYQMFFGFEAPLLSFMFWIMSSLILSIPFAIFWADYRFYEQHKLEYYPTINNMLIAMIINLTLALFFVTIPPFGIGGWANPILGFAWLPFFTGTGFIGIILGILFVSLAAKYIIHFELTGAKKKELMLVSGITIFLITLFIYGSSPTKQDMNAMAADCLHFKGIFTEETKNFSESSNETENAAAFAEFLKKNAKIDKEDKFIILPEIAAGIMTKEKEAAIHKHIKASGNNEITIAIGAITPADDQFENGIYFFSGNEGEITQYLQRFPTPFSMWFPWHEPRSFKAHWFDKGIIDIHGQKAIFMICPEYLFAFPILYSFASTPLAKPKMIIAINDNKTWPKEVKIPELMDQHLLSWSRLFGVPVLMAENFPVKNKH